MPPTPEPHRTTPHGAKPIVGLTGGIASGKSTVGARLRALGVPVVDADALAREVVAPHTPGLAAVVQAFGESVLTAEGELDRKALGALVFADEAARKRLEAITHPRIAAAGQARLAELATHPAPYRVYEAALLVENGLHRAFPALVVVAAREETQLARLRARDGLDEAAARARLAAQLPLADKIAVATDVLHNDGDRATLLAAVDALDATLRARFEAS
ncbi:MAG: dephospho-CoA kinase [Myxococcota bacterium]